MKNLSTSFYLTTIYLFFYIPIITLIIYSFNRAQYSLLWHGFSLRWYQELLTDTDLWIAAGNTIILGISASTIAVFLGMLIAINLIRYHFFGRQLLYALIFIMILSPDIVMGIALLILFTFGKIKLGYVSLLLAHITFCVPYVVVIVYSRMASFDEYIFEAAKDLGAKDTIILKQIILPLLWPALIAGWLLSFSMSIDDVIISYFVAGPDFEILPLKIYSMVRLGVKPEINALCAIMFAITLILVFTSQFILRKKP
jgi:spermidine/putrescine transport system permease protein